jgi:hypothetical protein
MVRIRTLAPTALVAAALALSACSTAAPVTQADQPTVEALSTPPPMPTAEPVAPTPVPPAAPTVVAEKGGQPLRDTNFSGATSLADWRTIETYDLTGGPSVWAIADGQLRQETDFNGGFSDVGTALVTGDAAWQDYTVSASALTETNEQLGVVARAGDGGFYVLHLVGNGGNQVVLARFDAGDDTFATLATAEFPVEMRRWYRLSLSVQGSTLVGSIDGTEVLRATDTTLGSGQAGVYGFATGGLIFDDFGVVGR